jgi:integrase
MARVFKRNTLGEVPTGATINGGEVVWKDADGRNRKARTTTVRGQLKLILGRSPIWYGKLREGKKPNHRWRTIPLFSDKGASESEIQRLQADADKRAAGLITLEIDAAAKPLCEHVDEYLATLKGNVADDHYRIVAWMTRRLLDLTGWTMVADISPGGLRDVSSKLTADGKAQAYCNKFISRAKSFVHWMIENKKMQVNPLETVRRSDSKYGRKTRARRALLNEELAALLAAAPEYRRQKYQFAALSGLRRSELADLRWDDLRLNAPIPFIQLRPEQTKNGKADIIPLHPSLVKMLEKMADKTPDAPIFGSMPDMKSMAKDLLAAGVAHRDDKGKIDIADRRGRRTDFHALRHTFKSNVDRTGCTEAVSDALTRHGDKTIADGYRHAELAEMLEALKLIPDLSPENQAQRQSAVMNGTTGAHHGAHQAAGDHVAPLATIGDDAMNADMILKAGTPDTLATIGDDSRSLAGTGDDNRHNPISSKNLGPSTQVD